MINRAGRYFEPRSRQGACCATAAAAAPHGFANRSQGGVLARASRSTRAPVAAGALPSRHLGRRPLRFDRQSPGDHGRLGPASIASPSQRATPASCTREDESSVQPRVSCFALVAIVWARRGHFSFHAKRHQIRGGSLRRQAARADVMKPSGRLQTGHGRLAYAPPRFHAPRRRPAFGERRVAADDRFDASRIAGPDDRNGDEEMTGAADTGRALSSKRSNDLATAGTIARQPKQRRRGCQNGHPLRWLKPDIWVTPGAVRCRRQRRPPSPATARRLKWSGLRGCPFALSSTTPLPARVSCFAGPRPRAVTANCRPSGFTFRRGC